MLKNLSLSKTNEDGFTLIELLIVIVIIGILAAIAIPVFLSQAQEARNASVESDVRNAATAVGSEAAREGFDSAKFSPESDTTPAEYNGVALVSSNNNKLFVTDDSDGNFKISGYNTDEEKYTVIYTSSDGRFSPDKTSAESSTSGTGSSTSAFSPNLDSGFWYSYDPDNNSPEFLSITVNYTPAANATTTPVLYASTPLFPQNSVSIDLEPGVNRLDFAEIARGAYPAGTQIPVDYEIDNGTGGPLQKGSFVVTTPAN